MEKKDLDRMLPIFIWAGFAGVLLIYVESLALLGGFLLVGAAAGIIFIQRRKSSLPSETTETAVWEKVRARGKKTCLLKWLKTGLFYGVCYLGFELLRNVYDGKPAFEGFGLGLLLVMICCIFLPVYAANEFWKSYERRFGAPSDSTGNK